jgi:CheY-like chemotaxis protein
MGIPVLVVEHDEANLMLIEDLLGLAGFAVTGVRTAARARELLSDGWVPQLIVIDPGNVSGGLELVRWTKEQPLLRGVPALAVTGLAMKGERERLLEAGCDEYLAKPFDTRHFGAFARGVVALRQFAAFSRSPRVSTFREWSGGTGTDGEAAHRRRSRDELAAHARVPR